MIAHFISSGSVGNCLIVTDSKGKSLMIDAGVNFKRIQQALNFDYTGIEGCFTLHSHQDHVMSGLKCAQAGMKVYMSNETQMESGFFHHNIHIISPGDQIKLGEYTCRTFELKHDVKCMGLLVNHPESGPFVYITDTFMVEHKFPPLSHYLIEANYCEEILRERDASGVIHSRLKDRVLQSHLSINNCLDVLKANDLSKVNSITLLHLSESNSNAADFKRRVENLTGKTVHIAEKGLKIGFNLRPW